MAVSTNETERLDVLKLYEILDTPSEQVFDCITKAAADVCDVPIALISFIDHSRQWFKACIGLNVQETSRDVAFCAHAILKPDEIMEIEDATKDARFSNNPLVTGEPNIRFYAGMPLKTSDGFALGTLCVIDHRPRKLTAQQRVALHNLGQAISALLEDRRNSSGSAMAQAIDKTIRNGIVITDARQPDRPITYVNRGFEVLTGYSSEEVIGRSTDLLRGADTCLKTTEQVNRAVEENRDCSVTLQHYRKDGSFFWNELTVAPIRNPHGDITHFLNVQRDVTDRYIAEQRLGESHALLEVRVEERTAELKESEERYRELFENAGDLIQSVRPDGTFLYVNPAWLETLGYSREDLAGMNIFDVIHKDEREHCQQVFQNVVSGNPAGVVETRFVKKNGEVVHVAGNASCQIRDGVPVATRAIFHNITERIEVAESLKAAKESAEETAKTQSRFFSAASHDLRQPLGAIGLYLGVLDGQVEDPAGKRVCEKIKQAFDSTIELLDALLDISKLRDGSIPAKHTAFSPKIMLEQLLAANEPQASQKGLKLSFDTPSFSLYSDPALLQRILDNLVSNAIRYTERGYVDVRCVKKGNNARIEISDSGIGISKKNLTKIFGEYVQLDNPMRDSRKGLGLGLSIVKHIARILGHRIGAESVEGEGSCFYVDVPIFASEVPDSAKETEISKCNLNVLFIDDHPIILEALEAIIESGGHGGFGASNADEAIAYVESGGKPDIIVSDYRLPGMNGLELIARIRQLTKPDLPALIITGDISIFREAEGEKSECRILAKPVEGNELLSILQDLTQPLRNA